MYWVSVYQHILAGSLIFCKCLRFAHNAILKEIRIFHWLIMNGFINAFTLSVLEFEIIGCLLGKVISNYW